MKLSLKINITKIFCIAAAFLIVLSSNSITIGYCLKCSDDNAEDKCKCCCYEEESTDNNCCSDGVNKTDHICFQCNTEVSGVFEDKIIPSKSNILQYQIPEHHNPGITSAELNRGENFIINDYPESNCKILSITTILRI